MENKSFKFFLPKEIFKTFIFRTENSDVTYEIDSGFHTFRLMRSVRGWWEDIKSYMNYDWNNWKCNWTISKCLLARRSKKRLKLNRVIWQVLFIILWTKTTTQFWRFLQLMSLLWIILSVKFFVVKTKINTNHQRVLPHSL